jgi:cytochrome oxidase Cu insertion factor (SCO1/SenC/PrrC family)
MLKEKLEGIKAAGKTRIPPEAAAVMQRAIEDVRASGIVDRVVKVGQRAPDFTLPNTDGTPVSLTALLAKGPVVLSFFRGRW